MRRRRRIALYRMICMEPLCLRRWGATLVARKRPCPFCGSEHTSWVK